MVYSRQVEQLIHERPLAMFTINASNATSSFTFTTFDKIAAVAMVTRLSKDFNVSVLFDASITYTPREY